jgi:predicted DCC family thiol-disulfide oxidoreductase YuxK
MKQRWVLFFDGACPLCFKAQASLPNFLPEDVKLTVVDLNSPIAKSKNYTLNHVVLETPDKTFVGYHAWLQVLSRTKYSWTTSLLIRPCFILIYFIISKNRKIISKIMKL